MDTPQQTPPPAPTPYTTTVTPAPAPTPSPAPAPFAPPVAATPPVTTPPPSGTHTGMIVGILIAVLVLAAAFYFFFLNSGDVAMVSPSPSESVTPTETPSPTPTPDPTAGWQTYSNSQYGFEIKYPTNWLVSAASTSAIVMLYDSATPLVPDTDVQVNGVFISTTVGVASGSPTTISSQNALTTGWQVATFGTGFGKENFVLSTPGIHITQHALTADLQPLDDQILSTFKFTQ